MVEVTEVAEGQPYDEPLLIRSFGGPYPGTRLVKISDFGWPLPDVLHGDGGRYMKRGESALPPMPEGSHVVRGAEYEWEAEGSDAT